MFSLNIVLLHGWCCRIERWSRDCAATIGIAVGLYSAFGRDIVTNKHTAFLPQKRIAPTCAIRPDYWAAAIRVRRTGEACDAVP